MSTEHAAIRGIYEQWHDAWNERDLDRLTALYAEDAVIETPNALAQYPHLEDGILRGRDSIRDLFAINFDGLRDLFKPFWRRETKFFADGELLLWEYPRDTPNGEQVDITESIDIRGGKIAYQSVFRLAWLQSADGVLQREPNPTRLTPGRER